MYISSLSFSREKMLEFMANGAKDYFSNLKS